MTVDYELAGTICELLNIMLRLDRPATAALVANKVPCNKVLADSNGIPVSAQHGGHYIGMLDVANALCGIDEQGCGPIATVFNDDATSRRLENFTVMQCEPVTVSEDTEV